MQAQGGIDEVGEEQLKGDIAHMVHGLDPIDRPIEENDGLQAHGQDVRPLDIERDVEWFAAEGCEEKPEKSKASGDQALK